jgi:parallel beta-helix repeat protein
MEVYSPFAPSQTATIISPSLWGNAMGKRLGMMVVGLALVMGDRLWAQPRPVIHVDPQLGNDQKADGSAQHPYKTITSALRNHRQATLKLARGIYSASTGESFPLTIPSQVTILGQEGSRGAGVVIQGGGSFRSVFLGQQNVAIVLQEQAELRGVTVTNPSSRGFGVWIEKGSPTVSHSTLIHNRQDGISIAGRASPRITDNVLRHNSAHGITVDHLATPEISRNVIADNGFGISVRQDSAPQIIGNQIVGNRDGVVIQGQARPLLRRNQIRGNGRSGVVVLSRAVPDLGTAGDQGQNVFADNGEKDIHSTSIYPVAGNGNRIDPAKTAGKVDLQAERLAIAHSFSPSAPTGIAPIPPSTNAVVVSLHGTAPLIGEVTLDHLPPITTTPPEGDLVNQPIIIAPPVVASGSLARWRLVVPLVSSDTLIQVKALFPEAFTANRDGRMVVQVGAYSDRHLVLQRLQQLAQMGLQGIIEPIVR